MPNTPHILVLMTFMGPMVRRQPERVLKSGWCFVMHKNTFIHLGIDSVNSRCQKNINLSP